MIMSWIASGIRSALIFKRLLASPIKLFALTFTCYLVFNLNRLFDPPYWDAIIGIYSQGIWLMHNKFSLIGLMHQPSSLVGGPRYNPFLIHGYLFALLSTALSPRWVFLILHLLNIAGAATIVTLFAKIAGEILPSKRSALWILAMAVSPVFTGQVAEIYLEIPMTAMVAAAFFYLWRGATLQAALFCCLAYFFKPAALLLALVFALVPILAIFLKNSKRFAFKAPRHAAILFMPIALMILFESISPSPIGGRMIFWSASIYSG